MDMVRIFKKGHKFGIPGPGLTKTSHKHLLFIEIVCITFHLDDLKTVGGVGDTIFL